MSEREKLRGGRKNISEREKAKEKWKGVRKKKAKVKMGWYKKEKIWKRKTEECREKNPKV